MNFTFFNSYKQLNKWILPIVAIVSAIVILKSVLPTFEAFRIWRSQTRSLSRTEDLPKKLFALREGIERAGMSQQGFNQDLLLQKVTEFAKDNSLIIRSYPKPALFHENGMSTELNIIEVQGSFKNIVMLAYELEYIQKLGKIVSLDLKSKYNRQLKMVYLLGTFSIQNVKYENG